MFRLKNVSNLPPNKSKKLQEKILLYCTKKLKSYPFCVERENVHHFNKIVVSFGISIPALGPVS